MHIYLNTKDGSTIAINTSQKPKPSINRMHVVYEFDKSIKKYTMSPFPEIPDNVLFSNKFIYLGKISEKNSIPKEEPLMVPTSGGLVKIPKID